MAEAVVGRFSKILQYLQKNICVGVFLKKVAGLEARKSVKRRLQNIAKFLRTAFSVEHL